MKAGPPSNPWRTLDKVRDIDPKHRSRLIRPTIQSKVTSDQPPATRCHNGLIHAGEPSCIEPSATRRWHSATVACRATRDVLAHMFEYRGRQRTAMATMQPQALSGLMNWWTNHRTRFRIECVVPSGTRSSTTRSEAPARPVVVQASSFGRESAKNQTDFATGSCTQHAQRRVCTLWASSRFRFN